jgi:hypothetical protein
VSSALQFAKASPLERRTAPRSAAVLFGRLMRADKQEYDCETVEVALGGLVITADIRLEVGEPLIANFDLLGSVVGRILRKVAGGYVLVLETTPKREQKLAQQIAELSRRLTEPDGLLRRHRRAPVNGIVDVDFGGKSVSHRCLNISVSGALLASDDLPDLGVAVSFGGVPAKVVRHDLRGFAVAFDTLQPSLKAASGLIRAANLRPGVAGQAASYGR